MENNNYVIRFIIIMTAVVALGLTGLREVTNPRSTLYEEILTKRGILQAVEDHLPGGTKLNELSNEEVAKIFSEQIEQVSLTTGGEVIDGVTAENIDMSQEMKKAENDRQLPLFIYNSGNKKFYITKVRGKGLWNDIWANIALEEDLNTIAGAVFDHEEETPGLGAEIKDNPDFRAQFAGKKLYDGNKYVSITVRKGGAKDPNHEVDGISGATITSNGVTDMMVKGMKSYEPYFKKLKK